MANKTLPSPEKVRLLTASKTLTPDEANRHGDLFFEAGLYAQAMQFYERSKSLDRLQKVKDTAIASGDAFLLFWISRLAPDVVSEEEWARTGEKALEIGKIIFARDCFEKANQPDRAAEARQRFLAMFPRADATAPSSPSARG
jgi:tetratricopeptide (TPR) repeat protein